MTSKHDGMGNSFILAMILLLAGSQNEISKGKKKAKSSPSALSSSSCMVERILCRSPARVLESAEQNEASKIKRSTGSIEREKGKENRIQQSHTPSSHPRTRRCERSPCRTMGWGIQWRGRWIRFCDLGFRVSGSEVGNLAKLDKFPHMGDYDVINMAGMGRWAFLVMWDIERACTIRLL
jgi:hypothetical protein